MAIRLRYIDGRWVALCAAKSHKCKGDIYLDDAAHDALAHKFGGDWRTTGHDTPYAYDPLAIAEGGAT